MQWDLRKRKVYKRFTLLPLYINKRIYWLETVYIATYWDRWSGWWRKKVVDKECYEKFKGSRLN